MATIDLSGPFTGQSTQGLGSRLRGAWQMFLRRRRERQTLEAIAHLGPRLMRDAGLDPDQIESALGSGWDRTDPVGIRLLLPRGNPF